MLQLVSCSWGYASLWHCICKMKIRAALFANPLNLLVFPATIVAVAAILAFSIWLARLISQRLMNAQIQTAQGKIRLDEESGEGGTAYYVFVGKKKFAFGEDMSSTFREGEIGRAHV